MIGIENPVNHPFLNQPMTSMPFFKPVTLDPRLASLLISLAYSKGEPPSVVIDPFSGTGCIPIQAHHRGIPVLASDLDPEMVDGTTLNLNQIKFNGEKIIQSSNATELHKKIKSIPGAAHAFLSLIHI